MSSCGAGFFVVARRFSLARRWVTAASLSRSDFGARSDFGSGPSDLGADLGVLGVSSSGAPGLIERRDGGRTDARREVGGCVSLVDGVSGARSGSSSLFLATTGSGGAEIATSTRWWDWDEGCFR